MYNKIMKQKFLDIIFPPYTKLQKILFFTLLVSYTLYVNGALTVAGFFVVFLLVALAVNGNLLQKKEIPAEITRTRLYMLKTQNAITILAKWLLLFILLLFLLLGFGQTIIQVMEAL